MKKSDTGIGVKRFIAAAVLLCSAMLIVGALYVGRSGANIYNNDYYTIELPEGWTAEKDAENSECHAVRLYDSEGNYVTRLLAMENFRHEGMGVEGLRQSYEFVRPHGRLKEERVRLTNDGKMAFYRVVTGFWLSPAAQDADVEPWPDTLYFLYINDDNLFLCVDGVENSALWGDVEESVKTMKLKLR